MTGTFASNRLRYGPGFIGLRLFAIVFDHRNSPMLMGELCQVEDVVPLFGLDFQNLLNPGPCARLTACRCLLSWGRLGHG
ncbi:hypothetical protein ABIE33_003617 [Ensifer sp. 4252]